MGPGRSGALRACGYAGLPLLLLLLAAAPPAAARQSAAPTPLASEWPLDARHFDASRIWRLSQGAGVTVAVVDTGVNARHPDLAGRVLPGTDVTGQAVDGRVDVSPESHGTSVAGVIAGSGGSGRGMAGLAPRATVLPVRVSADEAADPLALARGIVYAADHGAAVINISMVTTDADPQIRDAVAYARRHDIVVVAAAGNSGRAGNPVTYPAAFPGVVAVSGTTRDGGFWTDGESGSYVTLAAPAVDIYSTRNSGGYLTKDGTSYSAPYVSAAVALLRAAHPSETAGQIIDRLITTADRPGGESHASSGRDDRFGYGIVDPLKALAAAAPAAGADPLRTASGPGTPKAADTGGSAPGGIVAVVGAVAGAVAAGAAGLLVRRRFRRRT
ncbi:type VII secretion-associated serine protease mycosin [Streptomyces sp. NBC_01478]|uniref:type VII secretion-associated serine protease mycosin n=1 Tax=Streptomyces sp. NBC_01478 TaxID=2903882 RepID=UPI002E341369|nr:type VII secretion-associated serine protease mycosin [Streptomyces sp. NBC_01478]